MELRNLSVLNYAQGFTMWHYTVALGEQVEAPHFFDDGMDMFNDGDCMIVSGPDYGKMFFIKLYPTHVELKGIAGQY